MNVQYVGELFKVTVLTLQALPLSVTSVAYDKQNMSFKYPTLLWAMIYQILFLLKTKQNIEIWRLLCFK